MGRAYYRLALEIFASFFFLLGRFFLCKGFDDDDDCISDLVQTKHYVSLSLYDTDNKGSLESGGLGFLLVLLWALPSISACVESYKLILLQSPARD